MPPGFIQTETFLDLLSEGRYPISECYPTPDKESDDNEYGAHDMLLHAAAAMAIATTDAYPVVRARARQSQQLLGDYDIPYKDASDAVDTFMAHVDNGIHVMNCLGILIDDDHVPYFQRMLGWDLPRDQRDIYQQQVVDTICDPLSYGFRGLSGGTS